MVNDKRLDSKRTRLAYQPVGVGSSSKCLFDVIAQGRSFFSNCGSSVSQAMCRTIYGVWGRKQIF